MSDQNEVGPELTSAVVSTEAGPKTIVPETRNDDVNTSAVPPAPGRVIEASGTAVVELPKAAEPALDAPAPPPVAEPVTIENARPLPSFNGAYCSSCKETLTDARLVIQPLEFYRDTVGAITTMPRSCTLFCKTCMKFIGSYSPDSGFQRP